MKTFIGIENINDREYNVYQIDTGKQIATVKEIIKNQIEIDEEIKNSVVFELEEKIKQMQLCGLDCTAEQNELKGLLGL